VRVQLTVGSDHYECILVRNEFVADERWTQRKIRPTQQDETIQSKQDDIRVAKAVLSAFRPIERDGIVGRYEASACADQSCPVSRFERRNDGICRDFEAADQIPFGLC